MTDDLRTRIAAVLNANLPVMEFLRPGDTEYAADAVIRELGLKVEYGMAAQHDYSDKPEIHPVSKDDMARRTWYGEDWTYRYATEWEGTSE